MTSTARKPQKLPRGISELRPGTYRARVSYEGRQLLLGTFATVGDARAAIDIARGDIARGIFVPPGERRAAIKAAERQAAAEAARASYTLDDLAVEWLAFLERTGKTVSTVYSYRRRYEKHIKPVFGPVTVADVTADDVAGVARRPRCEPRQRGGQALLPDIVVDVHLRPGQREGTAAVVHPQGHRDAVSACWGR